MTAYLVQTALKVLCELAVIVPYRPISCNPADLDIRVLRVVEAPFVPALSDFPAVRRVSADPRFADLLRLAGLPE